MPLNQLDQAIRILKSGGLVAIPTETVYGLACDATNADAVLKVFESKKRPSFDPLIVHIGDHDFESFLRAGPVDEKALTQAQKEAAQILFATFWPGPLTLVLPKHPSIPDLVTSGLPTVGVRMPAHPMARELLNKSNLMLAAPSANHFGGVSPTTAEHVRNELLAYGLKVDLILDGGPCTIGVESTVLMIHADGTCEVLRPGGVSALELASLVRLRSADSKQPQHKHHSPGHLENHYAPKTKLGLFESEVELATLLKPLATDTEKRFGILYYGLPKVSQPTNRPPTMTSVLSAKRDAREAAHRLFSELRRLDQANLDLILAELPQPDQQALVPAIRDRLLRAAGIKSV